MNVSKELYSECKYQSYAIGERADCTVRAIAITTGEGYELAHYALEEQGRRPRSGTSICNMKDACKELGYSMERVEREAYRDRAKTAITASRLGWRGAFVLSFSEHVAAMVDGEVFDWVNGRRHRLQNIYRIVKKG